MSTLPWSDNPDPETIERFAAVLRYVDRKHDKGAAELAEAALRDWRERYGGGLYAAAHVEAADALANACRALFNGGRAIDVKAALDHYDEVTGK